MAGGDAAAGDAAAGDAAPGNAAAEPPRSVGGSRSARGSVSGGSDGGVEGCSGRRSAKTEPLAETVDERGELARLFYREQVARLREQLETRLGDQPRELTPVGGRRRLVELAGHHERG